MRLPDTANCGCAQQQQAAYAMPGAPSAPPAALFGASEGARLPPEALRLAQPRISAGPSGGGDGGGGGGGGSQLDLRQMSPGMHHNPSMNSALAALQFRRAGVPAQLVSVGSAPLGAGGAGGAAGGVGAGEGAPPAALLHSSASAGALGGSPRAARQLHAQQQAQARPRSPGWQPGAHAVLVSCLRPGLARGGTPRAGLAAETRASVKCVCAEVGMYNDV